MQLLRKRAEQADFFRGLFLFHSLAGGTGSGLGSRLIESYREHFSPKDYLLTASIWPAMTGETPLQQYNACLSLNCLSEFADGVFLF